ncbi:uncharacterized protein LOC142575860 isoform X3 [Dermacentor variabilis]|uniref:uncharacterized protein LOC142575860 isoform X3 n=1 Tax=Dermacentor variabilis TaxID=34621 RepID=UPI003F5C4689
MTRGVAEERGARPRCPAGETARSVTRRDQRLAAARRRGGGNVTAHSKWQLDGRPGESPAAANNGSSRARSCRRVSCPRNRALRALHVKKNLADRSRTTSEHHDHQGSHLVGWPCMQQLVVTNLFYHHQVTTPGDNISCHRRSTAPLMELSRTAPIKASLPVNGGVASKPLTCLPSVGLSPAP